jgi:hypothetical protein
VEKIRNRLLEKTFNTNRNSFALVVTETFKLKKKTMKEKKPGDENLFGASKFFVIALDCPLSVSAALGPIIILFFFAHAISKFRLRYKFQISLFFIQETKRPRELPLSRSFLHTDSS